MQVRTYTYNFIKKYTTLSIIIFLVCLGAARFAFLGYSPLRYDEIHNLIRAVEFDIYIKNIFLSFLQGNPSQIFHYLAINLFGTSEFANRFPVVIQSLIIVLFTYLMASSLFNKRTGVIAALISLLLPFNFAYSRYAQYDIGQTCFFVMGAYFFLCNRDATVKKNILSAIFFGLAFLSKYNSLILQLLIYFAIIVNSFKDQKRWQYVCLNCVSFLVAIVLFKLLYFQDFAVNLIGWLSVLLHGHSSAGGKTFYDSFYLVSKQFIVAFTLPIVFVLIYSVKNFLQRDNSVRVFTLIVVLYYVVLMAQGRLGTRYLNLISPFIVVLCSFEIGNLFNIKNKMKGVLMLSLLVLCFVAQVSISYYSYYNWERNWPVFREIGAFLQKDIEPNGRRIFLPKLFPLNYVGIMQLDSRFKYGSRYPEKCEIYHIRYSPYNCNEQSTKNARALLKEWLIENRKDMLLFKIRSLRESFKNFNKRRQESEIIHRWFSLEELMQGDLLKKGDVVLILCSNYQLYPLLWPKEPNYDELENNNIIKEHENLKTFHYNGTDIVCARIIRIK